MMKLDLAAIGSSLHSFFDPKKVQPTARETGFVRRVSELTGGVFLQVMVFTCIEHQKVTLKQFAQGCLDVGVEITAQGFDERISPESVTFMEAMFRQALAIFRHEQGLPLSLLQQFTAINIFDSSVISLPEALADEYPGCGGNASSASVKIQLGFEFLGGNLSHLAFCPGREPDQGYSDYLSVITAGSLNLMDLGYFKLDNLKDIDETEAYFLSRYLHQTTLLTPDGQAIELLAWLRSRPKQPVERLILLGQQKKHQIPARLIVVPLPQEVADRRRQKAKENAKRKGKSVSQEYLALLDWLIFVTNVPESMLSIKQVALLYRVRWQIELVFKLWKSYCGLRHVAKLRKERILTELYARLIGVVLTHFFVAPIRMPLGTFKNREISPVQIRKIFQRFARSINQVLHNLELLTLQLREMFSHISRFGFKDQRKKNPNICHALALAFSLHHLPLQPEEEINLLSLLA
jgi:hypothetical protein